jgi:hypothetical protein
MQVLYRHPKCIRRYSGTNSAIAKFIPLDTCAIKDINVGIKSAIAESSPYPYANMRILTLAYLHTYTIAQPLIRLRRYKKINAGIGAAGEIVIRPRLIFIFHYIETCAKIRQLLKIAGQKAPPWV